MKSSDGSLNQYDFYLKKEKRDEEVLNAQPAEWPSTSQGGLEETVLVQRDGSVSTGVYHRV